MLKNYPFFFHPKNRIHKHEINHNAYHRRSKTKNINQIIHIQAIKSKILKKPQLYAKHSLYF